MKTVMEQDVREPLFERDGAVFPWSGRKCSRSISFTTAAFSLAFLFFVSTNARSQSSRGSLELVGENGTSKMLTFAELATLPQSDVTVLEQNGSKVVFRGPTIRSLMTLVGAPTGHALRGPNMILAVLVEAADGYRVGFMLAELDEQFGARNAIVALTRDGRPLSASDGPLRIVVAGETHRARWVRQVVRLRLVRVM
ncbi:MAG TPA: hypothetical protein VNL96_05415 [Gemmatimonadaceae bacterium]|nr:hypothetical protein [Gemmatimonadaceae bacterium]